MNTSNSKSSMSSSPSKTSGQLHSMKGTAVETIGSMTNSQSLQESGKKEHAEGEAEYKAAQAKGMGQGMADRLVGKKDSILGSMTGDKSKQASGEAQQEKGKVQQKANEPA